MTGHTTKLYKQLYKQPITFFSILPFLIILSHFIMKEPSIFLRSLEIRAPNIKYHCMHTIFLQNSFPSKLFLKNAEKIEFIVPYHLFAFFSINTFFMYHLAVVLSNKQTHTTIFKSTHRVLEVLATIKTRRLAQNSKNNITLMNIGRRNVNSYLLTF